MAVFEKRTTAPAKDNRFYYKDNVFYQSGYGMPNCTAYSWGRFYELLDQLGVSGKPKLQTSNAENWYYEEKTYSKGQTPKLGAVIVWKKGEYHNPDDGAGHVAVVEEIHSDGSIVCSNSAYGGSNFYMTTHAKGYAKSGYQFEGFIYLPKEFDTVTTTVERDTTKDQLETLEYMNVRKGAGTNQTVIGQVDEGKIFNYYEVKESGEYTWYRIADGQWVAQNKENTYLKVYPKVEPVPEPDEKDKIIAELTDKVKVLEAQVEGLNAEIIELEKELTETTKIKESHLIEKDGLYEIQMYKNETLFIK